MAKEIPASSIQQFLEIKEIKDDVIILKDNSLRAILMASSVNFDLKSVDEQDAIIYQYQGVLNSFEFPVQIMITSRKFNINPYVEMLEQRQREQANELLRIQTLEYINFIKGLTEMTNVMTDSFYVVIPYAPAVVNLQKIGLLDKLFGSNKKQGAEIKKQKFDQLKTQLWQRAEFAASALRSAGVRATPLKTEELIELFYRLYNPSAKGGLEIKKANEIRLQ